MSLLRYLVTSRARRELLRLLWVADASASVSELSRLARVSFSLAHRELEAMCLAGLAACERSGNKLVYRANPDYPQASLMSAVANEAADATPAPSDDERRTEEVRTWLHAAGAPLWAAPLEGQLPGLEDVVVAGLALAHRDAAVAVVLPILLWRRRDRLDFDRLGRLATRCGEREALGYFLELTGQLGPDRRLVVAAGALRDRRRTRERLFFTTPHGRHGLALARRNTPRLARKWGYLMNMGLDTFADTFAKHTRPA